MGSTYFKKRIKDLVRPHNLLLKKEPKNFRTEAAAKRWADANKLTDYNIIQGRTKFKIVKK